MRIVTFLLSLTLFFFGCSEEKIQRFDVLIENGRIIDLETGAVRELDIFITDGKIIKVGDTLDYEGIEVSKKIDASGKYVLPGFWDNHVHFRGGDSLIKANKKFLDHFLANGITTVRDAGGDLTSSVVHWKKEIAEGRLVGPSIFTSGPKIDGANASWAGSLIVEKDEDILKALDSLEKIPVDFVKLYDSRISGENYLKTIAEAENRNLITSGHMPFTVELNDAIGAGIDAIEHLYYIMKGCSAKEASITQRLKNKEIGFWDAMPALMSSYNDTTAAHTFKNLKDNEVFVVPTLHIGKTLSYLDEVDHLSDPYLKLMDDGIIKTYEGRINRVKNSKAKAIADRKALDKFFGKLTKSLSDAGVDLLSGSDSGAFNSYTYPGISLHKEFQEMVANGISPLETLRTSAYNGAKFLEQDTYGSIAEGNMADIVLLDANPLENIEHTRKIYAVIKAGKCFYSEQLRKLLERE